MKEKLRPCDCIDQYTTDKLNEQGIKRGDVGMLLQPNSVIIDIGLTTTVKIPMSTFKMFAEWFLEEQELTRD